MMKPDASASNNFDRPKLLLFKFLAHQIHPFAFAVNTFLRPALDDCLALMHSNPQDTFNVLLSITQTLTRFAPESELIYDDIQQFAVKLKDAIDHCFTWLDPNTIRQSSQVLESTHQSLLAIIQQQNTENTTYTNMYKNMSAVLTNLEKINSLPTEMQTMSFDNTMPSQKTNKQESIINVNRQTDQSSHNGYQNGNVATASIRTTVDSVPPPPGMLPIKVNKPSTSIVAPPKNQSQLFQSSQNSVLPSKSPLMDQTKNLSVSSTPAATTASSILQPSSRPISTVSYLNEYEVVDTSTQPVKKPITNIAAFPPRQNASLFTSINPTNEKSSSAYTNTSKPSVVNGQYSSSLLNEIIKNDHPRLSSKFGVSSKDEMVNNQERGTPTPTPSNDVSIRFGNTPGPQTTSVTPSICETNDDDWDEVTSQPNFLNPRFIDPIAASTERRPAKDNFSVVNEQSNFDLKLAISHPHVTDEYIQGFGNKQNRPILRGELCMTYGTPQSGPQANCLPIGVGLSYDELTLLSCDVHRNAQNVRLFDTQTGRLKHTISSNQQMRFHRPSAVMSNPRNNILIVEKDYIYVTEPDGRLIRTLGHRSIKQLYGVALFRDRYILTLDSKSTDSHTAENSRLLLFDPNNGQLVFEQPIAINRQSESQLRQQYTNHIQGRVLPESTSKPRFLAVHNDDIYIADLGRSLIYGTSLRNQFEFTCTTVFGGQGRANGEMADPSGLYIDSGGNIISADSRNDRIQLFSSDGQYKSTFKLTERIKRPSGICANRAGTQFYVSCYLAGCVRAFNISY